MDLRPRRTRVSRERPGGPSRLPSRVSVHVVLLWNGRRSPVSGPRALSADVDPSFVFRPGRVPGRPEPGTCAVATGSVGGGSGGLDRPGPRPVTRPVREGGTAVPSLGPSLVRILNSLDGTGWGGVPGEGPDYLGSRVFDSERQVRHDSRGPVPARRGVRVGGRSCTGCRSVLGAGLTLRVSLPGSRQRPLVVCYGGRWRGRARREGSWAVTVHTSDLPYDEEVGDRTGGPWLLWILPQTTGVTGVCVLGPSSEGFGGVVPDVSPRSTVGSRSPPAPTVTTPTVRSGIKGSRIGVKVERLLPGSGATVDCVHRLVRIGPRPLAPLPRYRETESKGRPYIDSTEFRFLTGVSVVRSPRSPWGRPGSWDGPLRRHRGDRLVLRRRDGSGCDV